MNTFKTYTLGESSDKLKKLILENPELPVVVLAGEESWDGCNPWTFCSNISFRIEEILDCDFLDYHDCVFTDRDRLEEKITDDLYADYSDGPEEEYEAAINRKLQELEPYWTKVVAIYASN